MSTRREWARKRAGAAVVDGLFKGVSRLGRLLPAARPENHGVDVIADHGAFDSTAQPTKFPAGFFHIFTGTPFLVAGRNLAPRTASTAASLKPTFCVSLRASRVRSTAPFSSTRTSTVTSACSLRARARGG